MNKLYSYKITITTRFPQTTKVDFKCTKNNRLRQYQYPPRHVLRYILDTSTRWIWEDEENELYQKYKGL